MISFRGRSFRAFLILIPLLINACWQGACSQEDRFLDLRAAERRIFSQFGEDGVIEKIFQVIEPTHCFAVEFGAGDGIWLSNTRNLYLHQGWSGLMMEGDEKKASELERNYRSLPRVKTDHVWIYPGNIEILFNEHEVPLDFDLLSIDIDSNDYYVWKAIHTYRPKVVLIEFNAAFPPPEKKVVRFHPMNYWDGSTYFGASIQSLYELGKQKGYELVHCESNGANLFFVDEKYFSRFGLQDNSPQKMFKINPPPDTHRPLDSPLVIDAFQIEKEFVSLP